MSDVLNLAAFAMLPDLSIPYKILLQSTRVGEEEFRNKFRANPVAEDVQRISAANPEVGRAQISLNVYHLFLARPHCADNVTFMAIVQATLHIYITWGLEPVKVEQEDEASPTSNSSSEDTAHGDRQA